jgi:hypothetical protein
MADGRPDWNLRLEKSEYSVAFDPDHPNTAGAQMMRDAGVPEAAYGVYRHPDGRVEVYRYTMRNATRLIYYPDAKRLTVEDRRFRWDYFLTGMHARGGYDHAQPLVRLWAVIVDLVCAAMLLWVVTGLIMWWKLPGRRGWGWVALGAGVAAFTGFVALL